MADNIAMTNARKERCAQIYESEQRHWEICRNVLGNKTFDKYFVFNPDWAPQQDLKRNGSRFQQPSYLLGENVRVDPTYRMYSRRSLWQYLKREWKSFDWDNFMEIAQTTKWYKQQSPLPRITLAVVGIRSLLAFIF